MTRLIAITFAEHVPGLGNLTRQICCEPTGPVQDQLGTGPDGKQCRLGWTVSIRGNAVFVISPAGWSRDKPASQWRADGPRRVFEVPRSKVTLEWDIDDAKALDKDVARWDELMVRRVAEVPAVNLKEVGDA